MRTLIFVSADQYSERSWITMTDHKTVSIFGRQDAGETDRSLFSRLGELRYGRGEVDQEELKKRLNDFLQTMQEVIQSIPEVLGEFTLETLTLTAEISAKGQVSLLGTGGEIGGKGGLTFTLKRQPTTPLGINTLAEGTPSEEGHRA